MRDHDRPPNHSSRPYPDRMRYPMNTDTAPSIFARQIHDLRRARGWSQPDLAEKVGVSSVMIGRYERGEMTPSVDVGAKLAAVFGVTMDHLFHGTGVANALQDKSMLDRWDTLTRLPAKDRTLILGALDALIRDAKARQTYGGGNPPQGPELDSTQ